MLKNEDIDYTAKCIFRINKEYNTYAYFKKSFKYDVGGIFKAYRGLRSYLRAVVIDGNIAIPCVWSMIYSKHPDTLGDVAAKVRASIAVVDFAEMLMKRETLKNIALRIINNELSFLYGTLTEYKPSDMRENCDVDRIIEIFGKYGGKYDVSILRFARSIS